jgi:hypothetical protein
MCTVFFTFAGVWNCVSVVLGPLMNPFIHSVGGGWLNIFGEWRLTEKVQFLEKTLSQYNFVYHDTCRSPLDWTRFIAMRCRLLTAWVMVWPLRYSRITSTKSLLFWRTTFSASLTNHTALLPQSRDSSYYVSRPILALLPLWLQKHADLRAHDFAHFLILWRQPRLTCACSWRLGGINPAMLRLWWSAWEETALLSVSV